MADNKKENDYENVLAQATRHGAPLFVYGTGDEAEGLYRLDGNKVRRLPIKDVLRKKRELLGPKSTPPEEWE